MKTIKILIILSIISLFSCKDIIDCDPRVEKDLLLKVLSPSDSLSQLQMHELDFGSVKMRTVNYLYVSIVNISNKDTITIYSLKPANTTGLFEYSEPQGLPFTINPNEDIEFTQKIKVKFIADAFNTGYYYDTLFINNNPLFYIAVKAKVRY